MEAISGVLCVSGAILSFVFAVGVTLNAIDKARSANQVS